MVEQLLLVLRIAFVLILALLIWRIVRLSARELRTAVPASTVDDSLVLSPRDAAAAGLRPRDHLGQQPRRAPAYELVVLESASLKPRSRIVIEKAEVVVGRSAECDAPLTNDPAASSRHMRIFRIDGRVAIEDLGSTNGTHVNGRRLAAPHELAVGDRVGVGNTTLEFREAGS